MSYGLSVSLVHPILSYLVRKGHDLDSFCRFAAFDRRILQDAEARIPEEELDRLLDEAAAFASDKQLGLHLGQMIEMSNLGILGYVLLNCDTIEEALFAYRRYNIIVCSGIDVMWETDKKETAISFKVRDPDRHPSRHAVEGLVCSLYHILVKLSCRYIKVNMLHFTHMAPDTELEYLNIFGVNPKFESEHNLLCLENETLQYPVILSNPELRATFETYAEELRNRLLYGKTFAEQVYKWMMQSMPSKFPTVNEAAQQFNVGVRTLQVNLRQEKTTYQNLFNKVRMEFAAHYLRNPRFTVADIAYLLKFSEPSAFQRAFKKWTGQTPGQFRKTCRSRQLGKPYHK